MTTVRVAVYRVGQKPVVEEMPDTLEGMQAIVGGYIEAVFFPPTALVLYCDEEGLIKGKPLNRLVAGRIPNIDRSKYDWIMAPATQDIVLAGVMGYHKIHGDFFFCRCNRDGDNESLTKADLKLLGL
jgi:hypothetical protein